MELNIDDIKKIKREIITRRKITNCRDPLLCMYDNEKLRHITKVTKHTYTFTYDKKNNKFIHNGIKYDNMNQITHLHYRIERPDRGTSNNAWKECEIYRNGKWISTHDLPVIEDEASDEFIDLESVDSEED